MYPNHNIMMFSLRMRWERGLNITCCTDLIPSLCPAFRCLQYEKARKAGRSARFNPLPTSTCRLHSQWYQQSWRCPRSVSVIGLSLSQLLPG